MANGKPGDNPYTDVVVWKRDHYSPKANNLIREIGTNKDRDELADLLIRKFDTYGRRDWMLRSLNRL